MTQLATERCSSRPEPFQTTVDDLRAIAVRGLRRMYLPELGLFAFRLRRGEAGDALEGSSRRYTAITLIGLAGEDEATAKEILGGNNARGLCRRLLSDVELVENLGDVALTLWAALALQIEDATRARDRLIELDPCEGSHPTVELAWVLTALSIRPELCGGDAGLAGEVSERLLESFVPASGLFPHWPAGNGQSLLRAHVSCFADLVYPIQALAHYHKWTGEDRALNVARQCAGRMCDLQGPEGQWWWHFDARTGRVVERYPVYAVHQDAMAPMALLDLQEAGGGDYRTAIERGLQWLLEPSETPASLVDRSADMIWRKVARHEPGKLSRGVQAFASRIHPTLRVPGLGVVLRPGSVDYECRPYHLGWLLYAWSQHRS